MAREKHDGEPKGIAVDCTFCGHRGATLSAVSDRARCPNCGERFTVHVTDRFTLVENDGWAVTVSVDAGPERTATSDRP